MSIMAQVQPRRKLVEKSIQQMVPEQTTSVEQDQIVSEQQSFAMVQRTLQTSVSPLAVQQVGFSAGLIEICLDGDSCISEVRWS